MPPSIIAGLPVRSACSEAEAMRLTDLDALEQAALVRQGEVSALELVEASIAAIEALNPTLNAVIWTSFDKAREAARTVQPGSNQPFAGVPILMKCLMARIAGQPFVGGYGFARKAMPLAETSDAFGQAIERAGFIVLGRTNVPDGAAPGTTEPLAFGPTRNPWNETFTPGGSSGGSAAAVAARMVALAHGTDGGGSIRGPASQTGLVGMKPSSGLVIEDKAVTEETGWYFSLNGALTRTVADSAAFLDAVSAVPRQLLAATRAPVPQGLRLGLLTRDPTGALPVDPVCVAAAERVAAWFDQAGHHIEPGGPAEIGSADFPPNFMTTNCHGLARFVEIWRQRLGRPLTEADLDPITWELAEAGKGITRAGFDAALAWQYAHGERIAGWFEDVDLLITPTLAIPPQPLGSLTMQPERRYNGYERAAFLALFCAPFNLSGNPAISLPLGETEAGMPVGVQLVARRGADGLLITLAAALERALPWADRTPAIRA